MWASYNGSILDIYYLFVFEVCMTDRIGIIEMLLSCGLKGISDGRLSNNTSAERGINEFWITFK